MRAEGAWRFRRPYPFSLGALTEQLIGNESKLLQLAMGDTVDLPAFVERDAVEWGIGADSIVAGFIPLVEMYQVILMHNDQPLLIRNVDTRLTLNLRTSWLADTLEGQLCSCGESRRATS